MDFNKKKEMPIQGFSGFGGGTFGAAFRSSGDDTIYGNDIWANDSWFGNGTDNRDISADTGNYNNSLIDFSTHGGLIWTKPRENSAIQAWTYDKDNPPKTLRPQLNNTPINTGHVKTYEDNGLVIDNSDYADDDYSNDSSKNYMNWSMRYCPGFVDFVTYTGNGQGSPRAIAHNLGADVGFMVIKNLTYTYSMTSYHCGVTQEGGSSVSPEDKYMNWTGSGTVNGDKRFGETDPTDTHFYVEGDGTAGGTHTNKNGSNFGCWLFAKGTDSGSQVFGADSDEAMIKCGSYLGNGATAGQEINLGWECNAVILSGYEASQHFHRFDEAHDFPFVDSSPSDASSSADARYQEVTSTNGEKSSGANINRCHNGFHVYGDDHTSNKNGYMYWYVAFRSPIGKMRRPIEAESINGNPTTFKCIKYTGGNGSTQDLTFGFPVGVMFTRILHATSRPAMFHCRGISRNFLSPNTNNKSYNFSDNIVSFKQDTTKIQLPAGSGTNEINGSNSYEYGTTAWGRDPQAFDYVISKGTNDHDQNPVNHNLVVAPELKIIKCLSANSTKWIAGGSVVGDTDKFIEVNNSQGNSDVPKQSTSNYWGGTDTATQFYWGTTDSSGEGSDGSDSMYIACLWASKTGVQKVGTYAGTGSTRTITVGFQPQMVMLIPAGDDGGSPWLIWNTSLGSGTGGKAYHLTGDDGGLMSGNITPTSTGFTVTTGTYYNSDSREYIYVAHV